MSKHKSLDLNNDGIISEDELKVNEQLIRLENEDKKQDAQRKMAWVAIISMIAYAILPLMPFVPEARLETIAAMSDMLFLSQASIVGLFFGASAYMSRK